MSLGIQSQLIETATAKLKVGNKRKRKFEDLWKLLFLKKKKKKKSKLMSSKLKSNLRDYIPVMLCYLESYYLRWQPPI